MTMLLVMPVKEKHTKGSKKRIAGFLTTGTAGQRSDSALGVQASGFAALGLETELFGQEIVFHLQSANSAVEIIYLGFAMLSGIMTLIKNLSRPFKKGTFPAVDHCRVNAEPGSQFGDRILVF